MSQTRRHPMVKSLENAGDIKECEKILSEFKNDEDVKYMIEKYKLQMTQK